LPREQEHKASLKSSSRLFPENPGAFMIECIMATASVQQAPGNNLGQVIEPLAQDIKPAKQDVATELYYYKDSDDGTPPAPAYVG
jgi:hypothetical protein